MKKNHIFISFLLLSFMMGGCKKGEGSVRTDNSTIDSLSATDESSLKESKNKIMIADSVAAPEKMVHSSAAAEQKSDSTHRFIRTAELKFKTKNVVETTYDIENITNKMGGYVSYTNLKSNVDNVDNKNISSDSSLIITHYTISNEMTLRVPNTKLDSTLKLIAKNIQYLDYRIIKADNVALQMYSNNLAVKRNQNYQQRVTNAIDNRGRKLTETTDAEENLLNNQENADNARIENMSLQDQIKYSTVTLSIYQNQGVMHELIVNEKSIKEYEPNIGIKIVDALKNGWYLFESIFIFFVSNWAFLLIGSIAYFAYRRYQKNNNKNG